MVWTDNSAVPPKSELPSDFELIKLFKIPGLGYEEFKDRNPSPVKDTCKWLDDNKSYIKWMGQSSGVLLVTANPGCGKSVLAKSVVDKLQKENPTRVCHFFFKDDSEIQRSATEALCSLLHQIFVKFTEDLPKGLRQKIAKNIGTIRNDLWTLWELLELLSDSLLPTESDGKATIVCILDGLDECEESERRKLLDMVWTCFNYASRDRRLKFFFTSRPYPAVMNKFHSFRDDINLIHIEDNDQTKYLSGGKLGFLSKIE